MLSVDNIPGMVKCIKYIYRISVTDPMGLRTRAPYRSNFNHFHAVFGNNLAK